MPNHINIVLCDCFLWRIFFFIFASHRFGNFVYIPFNTHTQHYLKRPQENNQDLYLVVYKKLQDEWLKRSLAWIMWWVNICRYQITKYVPRYFGWSKVKKKKKNWNYKHAWEAFMSVKIVKPKYINKIGIKYGCLSLSFNNPWPK